MNELAHAAKFLSEIVTDLDQAVEDYEGVEEPDYIAFALIEDAAKTLTHVRTALAGKIAKAMPEKLVVIDGFGSIERHHKKSRTRWDSEALRSAVLDSRLFDHQTGEIIEETPTERILHVWNLGAPRLTALRARNIDADEFCTSEDAGYGLEIHR